MAAPQFAAPTAMPADMGIEAMIRGLIANELDAIRAALETLGDELCDHPVIIERFNHTLQCLDEIGQRNENLARVLRAAAMEPAIDRITLESLRLRLAGGMNQERGGD